MQAIDILKNEHNKLHCLLDKMAATADSGEKRLRFGEVRHFLSQYFFMEEAVFYPALVEIGELQEYLAGFYDQQQDLKDLLDKIEATTNSEVSHDYLNLFQQRVASFIALEAHDLLPTAQRVLSDAVLRQLGLLMADAKGSLDVAA